MEDPSPRKKWPALERISRPDLQEETTTRLAKMIAASEPGSRLPSERELCEELGVGRSTLREAMRSLSFIGAIQSRQGDGRFISTPDEQSVARLFGLSLLLRRVKLKDLVEARKSVEVEAARIAAQRHTEADRKTLQEIMQAMHASLSSPAGGAASRFDLQYHVALARASHNWVLVYLINGMRSLLEIWMNEAPNRLWLWREAASEHDRLLEAVFERDGDRAADCMRDHLTRSAERVFSELDREYANTDYIQRFW